SEVVTVTSTPQIELATGTTSGTKSSLSFDGTDDFLKLPTISNIRSIGFWTYISSSQDGGNNDYLIDGRTGLDETYLNPNGTSGLSSAWSKLYMNGNQITNFTNTSLTEDEWIYIYLEATSNFSDDLMFMSHYDGGVNSSYVSNVYLNGKIDDIALWSSVLTAAEITALYNSGSGLSASSNSGNYASSADLIGYWPMNEGSGTSLEDISGGNNNATIVRATWSTDSPISGGTKGDFTSGSESTVLTFNYTVASADTSSDLDYTSTGALSLNSGTIKDAAGNAATLTLASPG
ncbi:uncharacterized protein METZ01_LOCUS390309, partial [marine metagenome]